MLLRAVFLLPLLSKSMSLKVLFSRALQNQEKSRVNPSGCHWHCHRKRRTCCGASLLSCAKVSQVNNKDVMKNRYSMPVQKF